MKQKSIVNYFNKTERTLLGVSASVIVLSFLFFDRESYLTLFASLIGITSLLFNAKGHPIGQLLMIVFSLLYGIISYTFSYYGEMITYLGMTMPMAVLALISWVKHPYKKGCAQVKTEKIKRNEWIFMFILSAAVTAVFYFVLSAFNTANIIPATLSVTTSFIAVYLTFRRSPYYALAYAANDVVLIILWILASIRDLRYISVTVCFCTFLVSDMYGFICWRKMEKLQNRAF